MGQRNMKNSFVYLLVIMAVVAIFFSFLQSGYGPEERSISEVVEMASSERLSTVVVDGDDLTVTTRSGEVFTSRKEEGSSFLELLEEAGANTGVNGVRVTVKGTSGFSGLFGIILSFLPIIFIGGLLLFMMRQAQGASSQTMNFGKSRARVFIGARPTVTFNDVAGEDEPKEELQEVVEFLRYPERFTALGARVPRGVLLVGPPGTGKTLLARAVAGEAGVPFFSISGSEFVEMFVGVGASRVRDLFDQAKKNSPCIIFVDEIDAVGRHRGAGVGGGHDEREQTLNQILVEMDGFDTGTNVIILAATNRPDILDPALLRPGRFDRRVVLDLPDTVGRKAILDVHSEGKPIDSSVDKEVVSKQTPGFSGADLANLVNEAAILAARRSKKSIGPDEFGEAIDRVIAGPERKSRVVSAHEKELTAYHEAGHALVANLLPHADATQKISIIARGAMGGYTRFVPDEERHLGTKAQFQAMLAVAMGGRVAEQVAFGDITTGASNDFEQATRMARNMVTRFAMTVNDDDDLEEMPISSLFSAAKLGKIERVAVYGDDLAVTHRDGTRYRTRKEPGSNLLESFVTLGIDTGDEGVQVEVKGSSGLAKLGPRTFGKREELVFLGREISEQKDYSDKIAEAIDEQVHDLVDKAYHTAHSLLESHKLKLQQIAEYLIQFETVEGDDLQRLFSDEPSTEAVSVDKPEASVPSKSKKPQTASEQEKSKLKRPRGRSSRKDGPGTAPAPAS